MDFPYSHHNQQATQPMYQHYPSQYHQHDFYPQEYVQESSFLEEISQSQAATQYVDPNGYFNIGPAIHHHQANQLVNNYNVAPTQMHQPSPIVHAPIPILGAQFQGYGAYEVPDPRTVVSDPNVYSDAEYLTQSRYTRNERGVYPQPDVTQSSQQPQIPVQPTLQPQPQSWDEVVPQPFSGPTFPTPSELLVELRATFQGMSVEGGQAQGEPFGEMGGVDFSQEGGLGFGSYDGTVYGQRAPGSRIPSPSTTIQRAVDSASPEASSCRSVRNSTPRSEPATRSQPSQRTAASRSVSVLPDAVPNTTSNPESISSHEKKRRYLECLEQYVMYLHNQFSLLGKTPVRFKRLDKYEGLNSRSIRTLLVHMEHNNKKLNTQTVAEETRFLALREEVYHKIGTAEEGDKN